jgi:hypothetical protein
MLGAGRLDPERVLGAGRLDPAGRMLGGGGRILGGLGSALGELGRMLGVGAPETPRTGGGGGVPDGRASGARIPSTGRGGSVTGRGGCATGREGSTDDAPPGVAVGVTTDTGAPFAAPARFSLSLAVPCSSPMAAPRAALSSIARPFENFVRERLRSLQILVRKPRETFKETKALRGQCRHASGACGELGRSPPTFAYL